MKKYLFSLSAVVLALGAVAFTMPKVSFDDVSVYMFQGDPTDRDDVENLSNWKELSSPPECIGSQKACEIVVSDAFLQGSAPNRTLDPNDITIVGQQTLSGYIPKPATGSESFTDVNKN